MSALNITGVDPATDQLTIVAHGLNTGDGFAAIYTPNGAIPGGLAPVTDNWIIRVDADHVKLASASANALAGTAIDITDAGSGTLQLLIGLPYRVPRIATALSQIWPQDDNSTWQSLVALWNFLTGQAQSIFAGIVLAVNQNLKLQGTGYVQHGSWTEFFPFTPGGDWQVAGGSPPAWVLPGSAAVQVPAGSDVSYPLCTGSDKNRLEAIIVNARAFVGACTLSLYASSGLGGATESLNVITLTGGGTTLSVPADGVWNPRTLTLQTPTQFASGEMLFLRVVTPAGDTADLLTYGVVADAP